MPKFDVDDILKLVWCKMSPRKWHPTAWALKNWLLTPVRDGPDYGNDDNDDNSTLKNFQQIDFRWLKKQNMKSISYQ